MRSLFGTLVVSFLLVSCGGGGVDSGGSSSQPGTSAQSPALTFTSPTVKATFGYGKPVALGFLATVARPADFAGASSVHVDVSADADFLTRVGFVDSGEGRYSVNLQTSGTLAPGNHKGNFTVKICRDSSCASQFPGSPVTLPYDLTVQVAPLSAQPQSSLSVSAYARGFPPPPVLVDVDGGDWTVASTATWLKLTPTSGSGTSRRVSIAFDTTGLNEGRYSSTVTLAQKDGQQVTLPVDLTLRPPAFEADKSEVIFIGNNGAVQEPQYINFMLGAGVSWKANWDANWLKLPDPEGATDAFASGKIKLEVDPVSSNLIPGTYETILTLTSPSSSPIAIPVKLVLSRPSFTVSPSSIELRISSAGNSSGAEVSLALATPNAGWPWTLTGLPEWAISQENSGRASVYGYKFYIYPVPSAAPKGISTATATFTTVVNGDTISVPLKITLTKE